MSVSKSIISLIQGTVSSTVFSVPEHFKDNFCFIPAIIKVLMLIYVYFWILYFSIGWLRLLHHCLTHISDLEGMMASAAAPTANLLQTCAALLMSPYCGMHSPNIEVVLVKIGLQSTRIGLKLIDILLRNCAASGSDPTGDYWFALIIFTHLHNNHTWTT